MYKILQKSKIFLCISSCVTRGLIQVGKLSWKGTSGHCRGPTSQHSEKNWEMIVNPNVVGYTKTLNNQNKLRKTQKTTYWKPKEFKTEIRGARFLHLSCQSPPPAPLNHLHHWEYRVFTFWMKWFCYSSECICNCEMVPQYVTCSLKKSLTHFWCAILQSYPNLTKLPFRCLLPFASIYVRK